VAKTPGSKPFGGANHLFGLTVDASGAAYAADTGSRRVMKVTSEGRVAIAVTSETPWAPTGIAVVGDDFYLLEMGETGRREPLGPRVRKVSPGNKSEVLATVGE
jgi:hypothetical protein